MLAQHTEHPHQATGAHAAGVVVGDHRFVGGDPQLPHGPGERLGTGQRMATHIRAGFGREVLVEVHEHRAGQVAGLVGLQPGPPVQVPPHVAEDHVATAGGEVGQRSGVEDRSDSRGVHGRSLSHAPDGNLIGNLA